MGILFFSEKYHSFNQGLICRKYTIHKVDVYGDRLLVKKLEKVTWFTRLYDDVG